MPGLLLWPPWHSWALRVALLGASWWLLACLECLLALSCTIFVDLGAILVKFVYILLDLGSIFADVATLRVKLSPARELDFGGPVEHISCHVCCTCTTFCHLCVLNLSNGNFRGIEAHCTITLL